jgi:hypothetical protein
VNRHCLALSYAMPVCAYKYALIFFSGAIAPDTHFLTAFAVFISFFHDYHPAEVRLTESIFILLLIKIPSQFSKAKLKIPNHKLQIPNKSQIPIF